MSHSQKLALSYGLLSTDAGSTIKIMKSLRIFEDCLIVMCSASKVMLHGDEKQGLEWGMKGCVLY